MENNALAALRKAGVPVGGSQVNGKGSDTASIHSNSSTSTNGVPPLPMSFLYTHQGKGLDPEMTVEDAGIEDADEILAVELMDLTGPVPDDVVRSIRLCGYSKSSLALPGGTCRAEASETTEELVG